MSKFHIGQRVRIRFCYRPGVYGDSSGQEGVIWEEIVGHSEGHGWAVEIAGRGRLRENGWPHWYGDEQLDPILPSGHRSGDYSYTELMDRLKAGEVECV